MNPFNLFVAFKRFFLIILFALLMQSISNLSFAVTGRTEYSTGTNTDVFVTKLNSSGTPLMTKICHLHVTNANTESRRIIAMQDGGFVIIGWTTAYDPLASDIRIILKDKVLTKTTSPGYVSGNLIKTVALQLTEAPLSPETIIISDIKITTLIK